MRRTKIVIAGNHDISFDENFYDRMWARYHGSKEDNEAIKRAYRSARSSNVIYLEDESFQLPASEGGWKLYGSPWQPYFYDWGFNLHRGEPLRQAWARIPNDTQVLLTHGPPYRILDQAKSGGSVGCEDLLERLRVVRPLLHVFGHIHEACGAEKIDGTIFVNASTCSLRYRPVQEPFVVDLPWGLDKNKSADELYIRPDEDELIS